MDETRRRFGKSRPGGVSRAARVWLSVAIAAALACFPAGRSQTPGQNGGRAGATRPYYQDRNGLETPDDNYDSVMMERRLRALNVERQKQMVSDTNKLLKLAKELNDEVAASNTGELTQDQLHKIAEIEKLARSVKDRMAGGVGQPAQSLTPASVVYPVQ